MARKRQTQGHCTYCGRKMTRTGMLRHLQTCPRRKAEIVASQRKRGQDQTLLHLLVQDGWEGDFWLHLEAAGSARLRDLDEYLRAIWLECCGHMSSFFVGEPWGEEHSFRAVVEKVFSPGDRLTHIYDFGTSTLTRLKVIEHRLGKPIGHHSIALMARNEMPEMACANCENTASWVCAEQEDGGDVLCVDHARQGEHDEDGCLLPIVNSPRAGVCGYVGPAEPPY